MNEDGKKSFYALNLTEGRMFGIFIGIVIVLVAIFFTIFVTASKLSKPKANNMRVEKIETKQTNTENTESDFSFYTDLVGENSVKQDSVVTKEVVKLESTNNETPNQTEVQTAQAVTTESEPQVSIDNSEVLYSSRYQQNFKKEAPQAQTTPAKTNVATNSTQTQQKAETAIPVKTETATKTAETKTKPETKQAVNTKTAERYVVQIGSYTNKNVADEITNHYAKGGYPVYQQEFSKDGKTFYRLRVGPFKEKDRAENYLISIKSSKYGKNSYISKIYI